MNKSSISPAIIQDLFESASNAADKGQAQWFTPEDWGTLLSLPLCEQRAAVTDLTCGNGQLLKASAKRGTKLLGCDIDSPATATRHPLSFVHADLTRFYQFLVDVQWEGDCFALNPPWDMHWYRDRLKHLAESDCPAVADAFAAHDGRVAHEAIDSTIATLCIALDRSSAYGEGFLIANESTLQRLIFAPKAPHGALAAHVWAHLIIPGNICQPATRHSPLATFQTGIIWFARGHDVGILDPQPSTLDPKQFCEELKSNRSIIRRGAEARSYQCTTDAAEVWDAAAEEWLRLNDPAKFKRPPFNIWLEASAIGHLPSTGTIRTNLSLFDTRSGRVDKQAASALFDLTGKQPLQLVVQRSQRKALEDAVKPGSPWRVDPALQAAVVEAIRQYNAVRAPLYPLPKIQRIGYLDELDCVLCIKDFWWQGGVVFVAGKSYPIRSTTVAVKRSGTKMNLYGELDEVEWNGQELAFFITDGTEVERLFMEARLRDEKIKINVLKPGGKPGRDKDLRGECAIDFTLQELVDHFEIPEVPDVATLNPDGYKKNLQLIDEIERLAA